MDPQLPFSAPQSFTDPEAALAHARAIYESAVDYLRDELRRFVAGQTPSSRIRACYPRLRVRTDSVARADSRLAYGFVAGPGLYETTLTRPELFATYYRTQFELLLKNHGEHLVGGLEVGVSKTPIPVHFALGENEHLEGSLSPERRLLLRDLVEHATRREFVFSHAWREGDLVIWDNRQTMHRVRPFADTVEKRDVRRTTVAGDGPTVAQATPADDRPATSSRYSSRLRH